MPIRIQPAVYKFENGSVVGAPESVLRNELDRFNHSNVFSPSGTRSAVIGELVTFLEHSYRPNLRIEWPVSFGDEEHLCSIYSLSTNVHNSYPPISGRVGLSVGITLAGEVSLGVLRSVKSRSAACALCRMVLSIIAKDPAIDTRGPKQRRVHPASRSGDLSHLARSRSNSQRLLRNSTQKQHS
jgi:hypothetical protein